MKRSYTIFPIMAIFILLFASTTFGLPQFAASNGQPCSFCHVNPTGCWMRNTYGAQNFAQMNLPVHKISADDISRFKPAISDNISLGADARTLYIYNKDRKASTFFQMEGDFYISANLGDKFSIAYYADHSLNAVTTYQIWGMANILPLNGYIRGGRFQPSFGWRFADHSSFVRDSLGWFATYSDPGMEVGLYPSDVSFNVGLFNGSDGAIDGNQGKAISARLELRRKVGSLNGAVGASYWRNDINSLTTSLYGPFYYLSLLNGRINYLGEIDWMKKIHNDSTVLATTQNLSFVMTQGIWLVGTYDFIDPNTKIKSGTTSRFGIGLDVFPIAFLEVEPVYRYYRYDNGPGIAKTHNTDFHTEFHFFF